ncbi:GDSL-type esterase/lipase family protein [Streptomyces sp. NPDC006879]|uniref:GDSL-type esterase/lipase family protein n=1 Tax=Streptomyces sp. NPDC006879 TaxID=3364767 RepID=UPI00369A1109
MSTQQRDPFDQPGRYEHSIMIVGDSITHGSSGDYTWRYRFWQHLRAHGVQVDLAGPKNTLDNIRTVQVGDDDATYPDPRFDKDHDAQWGQPLLTKKDVIEDHVRAYQPDYLVVLLGINDLFWYGVEPPQYEGDLREFILNARRARPDLAMAFGKILATAKALSDPEFSARVDGCNERLASVADDLSTQESPVCVADTAREFRAQEHTWDGTHPNPNGEIRIAAAFADTFARRFAIGAPYPRPYPDIPAVPESAKQQID